MSTDLKAVADRVRRVRAGEDAVDVYFPGFDNFSVKGRLEATAKAADKLIVDKCLLADDHPLVKGEPATGGERCPRCNSPSPELHPAMQHEGEVEICRDPWHGPFDLRMHAPPPAPPADAVQEPAQKLWSEGSGLTVPGTTDARVWARDWFATIAKHPDVPHDEGAMIGWFANAIMAGYDAALTARAGEKG